MKGGERGKEIQKKKEVKDKERRDTWLPCILCGNRLCTDDHWQIPIIIPSPLYPRAPSLAPERHNFGTILEDDSRDLYEMAKRCSGITVFRYDSQGWQCKRWWIAWTLASWGLVSQCRSLFRVYIQLNSHWPLLIEMAHQLCNWTITYRHRPQTWHFDKVTEEQLPEYSGGGVTRNSEKDMWPVELGAW